VSGNEFIQPTIWNLVGGDLQVHYSSAEAHLHYQNPQLIRDFHDPDLRVAEVPDLGTLVSVTLASTIDSGSTTFTILLPNTNLLPRAAFAPVATFGITVAHNFSVMPAFRHGQQESYTVTPLQGTAI
jgi:hypothetical protein